ANLLEFKILKVDQGHALRRYNPGSRGNAKPYRKQFAHISVVVAPKSQPAVKSAQKAEVKTGESTEKSVEKKTLKVAKKPSLKKKTTASAK
ncbi:MAG: hypothetical protein NTZ55_00265, partial [Candidatus Roizmanbacteria bacterium]|nr:hypothetical protein [Candidatus Roizmanbacteria bacterium]